MLKSRIASSCHLETDFFSRKYTVNKNYGHIKGQIRCFPLNGQSLSGTVNKNKTRTATSGDWRENGKRERPEVSEILWTFALANV
jgi:hypothetical protein